MLFLSKSKKLLIFGGRTLSQDGYLDDMWTYDIGTGKMEKLAVMPTGRFTMRAVVDEEKSEVYV